MKTIEMLKIERKANEEAEVIALVPFRSGIYPTAKGDLEVEVFSTDMQGQQKVVFRGDVLPTISQRGKPGQFRKSSGKRRVVDFSSRPHKSISQDNGREGKLVFKKEVHVESEALAAD